MKTTLPVVVLFLGAVLAVGLAQAPGSARDEHGCIPSAGYVWCERVQKCARRWELALDLDLSPEKMEEWCATTESVVDNKDCLTTAGYSWCERVQKCVRPWQIAKELGFNPSPENFKAWCEATPAAEDLQKPHPILPGSDRDENGCIGSAGYLWCPREQSCIRSWELANRLNISNTHESIAEYCQLKRMGEGHDEHGCISSAGYRWCQSEGKCVRPWQIAKEKGFELSPEAVDKHCNVEKPQKLPGSDAEEHGCIGSAGYRWCQSEGKCVRPWEIAKEKGFQLTPEALESHCNGEVEENPPPGSDADEHGCIGSAGYTWCEAVQKCVRGWELAEENFFEFTAENLESFCSQRFGDEHSCTAAGTMWCGRLRSCVNKAKLAERFALAPEVMAAFCGPQ